MPVVTPLLEPSPVRRGLTSDQIEAIARQLPGRQERDLMRLQQEPEPKTEPTR
jgi:hypothetical protein